MKSKRHHASLLAIAAAIGLATFVDANTAHAQLFPRLRARLEPLLQPQPLPQSLPNPAVQPQPRPQSPLRPVQPIVRPNSNTPQATVNRPLTPPGSGSLGVDVEQMDMTMQGLRVTRISNHSRANEAGLREGDVIVAIDGQETPTIQAVIEVLGQRRAGESVVARVIRGRRLGQLTIPLVERSLRDEPVAAAKPVTSASENRQPTVASRYEESAKSVLVPSDPVPSDPVPADPVPATPVPADADPSESVASESILKRFGIEVEDAQVVRGAVVSEIEPGSVGQRWGFQVSDRIVSVDGEFVFTAARFESRMQQWDADKPLKLQLIRDERLLTLSLDPARMSESGSVAKSAADTAAPAGDGGDTGSMLEGVGAALGNFLAGQKKTNRDGKGGTTPAAPAETLPQPQSPTVTNPVANADAMSGADPLAFGDEEAIDQAAFEELATPKVDPVERAFDTDLLTRPRSETDATTKRGKELDAEIERLERKLEEMKAKAAEKK
ncbi:PDZ domain-containing protein [Novipirellula caenicola]|uniref:PDZ domain-containing protein n=1 Tax=Novipirellula caenicola TaxID=1536901 RepID=A0ABP9VRC6_9BACT